MAAIIPYNARSTGWMEYALFRWGVVFALLTGALTLAHAPRAAAQWRASGNLGAVSDYVYRGYSRSGNELALQAGLQASNGQLTLSAWGSQVQLLPRRNSTELDVYAHWRQPLTAAIDAGFTVTRYTFPGDPRAVSYNYTEFSASLDWRQRVRVEFAWSPSITLFTPVYGPQADHASWNLEITAAQPLLWGLVGFAGIGRFDAPQLANANYVYGSAGLSRDAGRWHFELSYFRTGRGASRSYQLGPTATPLVASIAWHF